MYMLGLPFYFNLLGYFKLTWPMPFWQHIKTTMTTVHPFCWNVIIIIIYFPFLWNSEKDETIPFSSCCKDSKLFLNALAFNLVMKSLHFDDEFKTVLRKISVKVEIKSNIIPIQVWGVYLWMQHMVIWVYLVAAIPCTMCIQYTLLLQANIYHIIYIKNYNFLPQINYVFKMF